MTKLFFLEWVFQDMVHVSDLRPDRTLLDPGFDGYKLDLEQFHPLKAQLKSPVFQPNLSGDAKFSFNHSKYSMLFNSLMEDRFYVQSLYYFDSNLCLHNVNVVFGEIHDSVVCNVSKSDEQPKMFCSVSFASDEHAIIFNGNATYFFYRTGVRKDLTPASSKTWDCLGSVEIEGFPILQSSAAFTSDETGCMDFVFCVTGFEVSNSGDTNQSSNAATRCQRVRFSTENKIFEFLDFLEFEGNTVPDLVSLNTDGTLVQVAGTTPFKLKSNKSEMSESAEKVFESLSCFQNSKCLRLVISGVQWPENDVSIQFEAKLVKVSRISDSTVVLFGVLDGEIDPVKCSHSFESTKKCLNIFLEKVEESAHWDRIFADEFLQTSVKMLDEDEKLETSGEETLLFAVICCFAPHVIASTYAGKYAGAPKDSQNLHF